MFVCLLTCLFELNALIFDFSGLGFVTGSAAASYFGSWEWALRVSHFDAVVYLLTRRPPPLRVREAAPAVCCVCLRL